MKLITLNTYGGVFFEPLMSFVKEQSVDTDIFCFQEILDCAPNTPGADQHHYLLAELKNILPNFTVFFTPSQTGFDPGSNGESVSTLGLAIFVRNVYPIKKSGHLFLDNSENSFQRPDFNTFPHLMNYVEIEVAGKTLTLLNAHGASQPSNKLDSPNRLAQTKKILDLVSKISGEIIITGDFNLLPKTKSITDIEAAGFTSLIKTFDIKTTRGTLLKQLHPEYATSVNGWLEYSDYTFITPGITPLTFTVPDLPLSDHLPLILEFKI